MARGGLAPRRSPGGPWVDQEGVNVMLRWTWLVPGCLLLTLATLPCPAPACSLCANLNLKQKQTFRQEAVHPSARLVLYGTLANPRLGGATPGGGVTDFRVE